MIYFNSNTKEIVRKSEAFDGEDLKDGVHDYPDEAKCMLPTNERLEELWAIHEKGLISELIEELEDDNGDQLEIAALRLHRSNLRKHKKNKGKYADRPVRAN